MKLKSVLGLIMALTAVGILTACGSSPTPTPKPAEPVTITMIGAFPDFLDVMKGVQYFVEETNRISNGNVTIDWAVRENVRAHLRVIVKRILRKHGYPPDKQEKATQTVLEQAEVLSQEWVAS